MSEVVRLELDSEECARMVNWAQHGITNPNPEDYYYDRVIREQDGHQQPSEVFPIPKIIYRRPAEITGKTITGALPPFTYNIDRLTPEGALIFQDQCYAQYTWETGERQIEPLMPEIIRPEPLPQPDIDDASELHPRAIVDHGTVVRESTIGSDAHVGPGSIVNKTTLEDFSPDTYPEPTRLHKTALVGCVIGSGNDLSESVMYNTVSGAGVSTLVARVRGREGDSERTILENGVILADTTVEVGSRLLAHAALAGCTLGKNNLVEACAVLTNVQTGPDVTVKESTKASEGEIGAGTTLGPNGEFSFFITGTNCLTGKSCKVTGERNYFDDDGFNVLLGDNVVLGNEVTIFSIPSVIGAVGNARQSDQPAPTTTIGDRTELIQTTVGTGAEIGTDNWLRESTFPPFVKVGHGRTGPQARGRSVKLTLKEGAKVGNNVLWGSRATHEGLTLGELSRVEDDATVNIDLQPQTVVEAGAVAYLPHKMGTIVVTEDRARRLARNWFRKTTHLPPVA